MKKRSQEKQGQPERKIYGLVLAAGVFFVILAWLLGSGANSAEEVEIGVEAGLTGEAGNTGLYNAGGGLNQRLRENGIEIELELPEGAAEDAE